MYICKYVVYVTKTVTRNIFEPKSYINTYMYIMYMSINIYVDKPL